MTKEIPERILEKNPNKIGIDNHPERPERLSASTSEHHLSSSLISGGQSLHSWPRRKRNPVEFRNKKEDGRMDDRWNSGMSSGHKTPSEADEIINPRLRGQCNAPDNGMLIELSKKPVHGQKGKEPCRPRPVHLFIRGSRRARSNELSPCDTHVTCRF